MKYQSILVLLVSVIFFFGCAKDDSSASSESSEPIHTEAELCILRSPETRLAGAIIQLQEEQNVTTVSNSAHGKESTLIATFKSTDGENDFYSVEIQIPGENFNTKDISYKGEEIIIYQNDDLVMLMRPTQTKG